MTLFSFNSFFSYSVAMQNRQVLVLCGTRKTRKVRTEGEDDHALQYEKNELNEKSPGGS